MRYTFDPMKRPRKWLVRVIIAGIVMAFVLVGAALLAPNTTNCGGNSAALTICGSISKVFFLVSAEHDNQAVSIADMSASEREWFAGLALPESWEARILVTPGKAGGANPSPAAIVAICDKPFNNVPRRMIGRAPLAHAVVYGTGRTGLLSVEEFERLDLTGFVDVRTIPDTKVKPAGADQSDKPATRSEPKTH